MINAAILLANGEKAGRVNWRDSEQKVFDSRDIWMFASSTVEPFGATGDPYDPFALPESLPSCLRNNSQGGHTLGEIGTWRGLLWIS